MSHYLVDRIERSPRIEVMTETEVVGGARRATVESVDPARPAQRQRRVGCATAVFVMIGADPCTEAARGMLARRRRPAICCAAPARRRCEGHLRWPLSDREPQLLETIRPGVFAAGDVRAGAPKRVAGAVGDGAMAVRFAHEVLAG